jgi:hypothetical protein
MSKHRIETYDGKGNLIHVEETDIEDTPIPVIDPIKARLDALEEKVGRIERETLIERRERI